MASCLQQFGIGKVFGFLEVQVATGKAVSILLAAWAVGSRAPATFSLQVRKYRAHC